MGKPRMIILIRHAQSEGNKNREIHQMVPDHRVKLTAEGHKQAREAGRRLRALLRPDDSVQFFTSPYRRTRETTEGIVESLSSDSPSPSPFPRHVIQVYEEPRLREQDFGNFQPCTAAMERMWLERADYGHFFYRIPNGESAADAYDRVSGFNESLWRLFGDDDFASVCVLVTHGLMTRVFLMKWYHWSVEYFEDLRNINHCEFVIMKLDPNNGRYILDNKLRTWSELHREKERQRQRDRISKGLSPESLPDMTIPARRKWGGCPDGCDHGARRHGSRRVRHDIDSTKDVTELGSTQSSAQWNSDAASPDVGDLTSPEKTHSPSQDEARNHLRVVSSEPTATFSSDSAEQKAGHPDGDDRHNKDDDRWTTSTLKSKRPKLYRFHTDGEDHLLHPPHSNSSFLSLNSRDDAGISSGVNSTAVSEDEHDGEPRRHVNSLRELQFERPSQTTDPDNNNDGDDEESGVGEKSLCSRSYRRHPLLSRDGTKRSAEENSQDNHDPTTAVEDNIEAQKREEQGIHGSVY